MRDMQPADTGALYTSTGTVSPLAHSFQSTRNSYLSAAAPALSDTQVVTLEPSTFCSISSDWRSAFELGVMRTVLSGWAFSQRPMCHASLEEDSVSISISWPRLPSGISSRPSALSVSDMSAPSMRENTARRCSFSITASLYASSVRTSASR